MLVNSKVFNEVTLTPPQNVPAKEENKISALFAENITDIDQNAVIQPKNAVAEPVCKKKRKKRKKNISPFSQTSQIITWFQEIFRNEKIEHPSLPTFNVWMKNFNAKTILNNENFLVSLYLFTLTTINTLKKTTFNETQRIKLLQLEYLFLKMEDFVRLHLLPLNEKEELKKEMKEIAISRIETVESCDFLNDSIKNDLTIISIFINGILKHPKLNELNQYINTQNVQDLIFHSSLAINYLVSLKLMVEQIVDFINLFKDYSNFLDDILKKLQQKGILPLINLKKNNFELSENTQVSMYNLNRTIYKKLTEIEIRLQTMNFSNIHKEILKVFSLKNNLIKELNLLTNGIFNLKNSHCIEFENEIIKNNYLTDMQKSIYHLKPTVRNSNIFDLILQKNTHFDSHINGKLFILFSLCLSAKNLEINNQFIIFYLQDVQKVLSELLEFLINNSTESNSIIHIKTLIDNNNNYLKYFENESNKNLTFAFFAAQCLLNNYFSIEEFFKDKLIFEINNKIYKLNSELDEDKILILKTELDNLSSIYERCVNNLEILRTFLDLMDTLIDQQEIISSQSETTLPKSPSADSVPSEDLSTNSSSNTTDSILPSVEKESPKLIKDITIEEGVVPSKISKKKIIEKKPITSKNEKKVEESPQKTLFDEYNEINQKLGWKAHLKRRTLLQLLRDNQWKINESAGKGSHVKAQGPNGTVTLIPNTSTIATGTLKSIKESVIQDQLKGKPKK